MSSAFTGKAPVSKGYEVPPAGQHAAVCIGFVDLGFHEQVYKDAKGERKEDVHQIMLVWELAGLPVAGQTGKNHIVGRSYNLKFGVNKDGAPGALRKLMEQFKGSPYKEGEEIDPLKLLSKKYLLALLHKDSARGKTYAKLDAVGPLPKEMACAAPKTTPLLVKMGQPLPEWVPYLFGEKVDDVRSRAIPAEFVGKPRAAKPVAASAPADRPVEADEENSDTIPF